MTRQRICVLFLAAALLALPIQPGARADAGPAAPKASGEVNFQISCGPAVQKTFREAVWTLHSFWYPEALKGFTTVTEAEPGCAMGYWGIAMSHWYPLWFPPSPAALKAGAEAVEKAVAAGPKTERENDYIAAIAAFYRDSDKLDHQTRAVAYEKAMEQVYLRDPEDREAAVFYGLALNASALAADLDATMDKHPATPAAVLPARELLADLLLELNEPGAALKEYEQALRNDPNRFRSILGRARAAKQLGDIAASRDAYQKLVALSTSAVSERSELSEAKAFLTN